MSRLDSLTSIDWRAALARTEESTFRLLSKLAFLFIAALLVIASATAGTPYVAAVLGVFAFIALRTVLPTDRFEDFYEALWSGEAGEWLADALNSALDWLYAAGCRVLAFATRGRLGGS